MEDFCSLLEMLWRPLIFFWGGELRIQRLLRFMKLSVRCDIFHRFFYNLQASSISLGCEFLHPLSSECGDQNLLDMMINSVVYSVYWLIKWWSFVALDRAVWSVFSVLLSKG
ncbi:uncharacterized protein LOC110767890 [Prunus avium]|uniref:Uncharacterized protein LOC110767890 n=1 Tax=Prunus avium TaxID=42229 RepID=A0A6P5TJQ3_PRUAV|nr:uncharacterized protein LOC110767890 [Prunus avium]